MSAHSFVLAAEIIGSVIAGLWIVGFIIKGIRRLKDGPDVDEPVDSVFITKYTNRAAAEGWLHRFLVVFDILVNVLARGQEDETVSARSYRAYLEGKIWGRVMTVFLNLYQAQHGPKAAVGDLWRAQNRVTTNKKVLGIK